MSRVIEREWSCLPVEILDLIVSKASFQDVNSFRAVCRQWHGSYYPQDMGFGSQWLVQTLESTLRLFHPLVDRPFTIAAELRGAFVRCSKDGWLLMSEGYHIFFFCPFSNSTIQLPDLPDNPDDLTGFTFTCDPTSEDCLVFGVGIDTGYSSVIFGLSRNRKNWSRSTDTHDVSFLLSHTNPVYRGGKLYFLHYNGDVRVFDPNDESSIELRCRDDMRLEADSIREVGQHNYLLDFDGKLLGVFLSTTDAVIKVCEWDEPNLTWQKIDDLGEFMLFVSDTTCFATRSARTRCMRNKIYFPKFNANGHMVFYCMEQGLFKTFESDSPIHNFDGTKLLLGCCWMEPVRPHNSRTVSWVDAGWCEGDDGSVDTNSTISAEGNYDFDCGYRYFDYDTDDDFWYGRDDGSSSEEEKFFVRFR